MTSFCVKGPDDFKEPKAREYIGKLCGVFGEPDMITTKNERYTSASWLNKLKGHDIIRIVDEAVPHSEPMPHVDFLYSTKRIDLDSNGECPISQEFVKQAKSASDSIFVDKLKCQVTARCGALVKNDATLKFLGDLMQDNKMTSDIKQHYNVRLLTNDIHKINSVFIGHLNELDMAKDEKKAQDIIDKLR